jgi:hypothetical protein
MNGQRAIALGKGTERRDLIDNERFKSNVDNRVTATAEATVRSTVQVGVRAKYLNSKYRLIKLRFERNPYGSRRHIGFLGI